MSVIIAKGQTVSRVQDLCCFVQILFLCSFLWSVRSMLSINLREFLPYLLSLVWNSRRFSFPKDYRRQVFDVLRVFAWKQRRMLLNWTSRVVVLICCYESFSTHILWREDVVPLGVLLNSLVTVGGDRSTHILGIPDCSYIRGRGWRS